MARPKITAILFALLILLGGIATAQTHAPGSYRYGFNGMEKDDEVKGVGNSYDFGARVYDSRIGIFLSNDPISFAMPWSSPYTFAANSPAWAIDYQGLCPVKANVNIDGTIYRFRFKNSQRFSVKVHGMKRMKFDFITTDRNRQVMFRNRAMANNNWIGTPLNSLGLLVSLTSSQVNWGSPDVNKMLTTYNNLLITDLIVTLLEQNKDISLAIIGSHSIINNPFNHNGTIVTQAQTSPEFEREFNLTRAETVRQQFFGGSNLVKTLAREDIRGNTYNGIPMQLQRNDPIGITIGFDFTKKKKKKKKNNKNRAKSKNPRFL